jgi:potassium channel subfamily K
VSAFVLIGLTACASGPLVIEPKTDHAFTQAFYYAIFSAGLYFLVATLMLVTVYGAMRGHYDKEFQLTMSQRTLMLQTISFLVYLLAGAAVYSHIEGWAYLDAVYWADFTLLTVGIGDYAPMTHLGRGLLFPFAIGGIIILGLVIGSIRSLVLERGKLKLGARMVEKQRRRLLKKVQNKNSHLLEPITDDGQTTMSRTSTKTLQDKNDIFTERERRRNEFDMMRKIQEDAATRRRWTSLFISGTTWMGLWFIGAAIFQAAEYGQDWSYFGSLYFSYTSLLTIGYGDFYPQSNSGKAFFVFWSLLAVPSLTILISNMGDTIVKGIRDLTLSIGTFTVLPDEKGVKANLKELAYRLTRGRFFGGDVDETAPGILGESNKVKQDEDEEGPHHQKNDPDSAAQRVAGDKAAQETTRAAKRGEGNDELPESRHHYHHILAKEIVKVMKHLNSSPPRKYTFDEWAWYLKLIGEDESSAATHRKAKRKPKADGEGLGTAMRDGDRTAKWSWVGNRSPLMGNKEEAEWVLERLSETLEKELEKIRREEVEGKGPWASEGPSTESNRTLTEEKKDAGT